MSQPERVPDGIAVRLRDARVVRINALAWGRDHEQPDWAKNDSGTVKLAGLGNDNLVAELTATFTRNLIGIEISMQGLYEVHQESAGLLPKDDEHQSIVARIPHEYRAELANLAGVDLFPFLRQAFHSTSIQLDPRTPIFLTPVSHWDVLTPEEPHSETPLEP